MLLRPWSLIPQEMLFSVYHFFVAFWWKLQKLGDKARRKIKSVYLLELFQEPKMKIEVSWVPVWLLLWKIYSDIIVFLLFLQEKICAVWQRDTRNTFFTPLFLSVVALKLLKSVLTILGVEKWKLPPQTLEQLCYLLEHSFSIAVIVAQMQISGLCYHYLVGVTGHYISY